jgi:hypothetical protein
MSDPEAPPAPHALVTPDRRVALTPEAARAIALGSLVGGSEIPVQAAEVLGGAGCRAAQDEAAEILADAARDRDAPAATETTPTEEA